MSEHLNHDYWQERARAVLPSATDAEIERAAFILAMQYTAADVTYDANGSTLPAWQYAYPEWRPSMDAEDPRDTKARTIAAPYVTLKGGNVALGGLMVNAHAFDGQTGGGVPDMTDAPDAWSAIKHTLRADGSKVLRHGNARVQGAPIGPIRTLPNGMTGALLGQMLEDLPRNSIGAIGWQVTKLTDLAYGPDTEFPALLGNDVAGAPDPNLARAIADPGKVRGIVGQDTADGPDRHMRWPMRTRLPRVTVRASEQVTRRGRLAAPHSDPTRIWFGHQCYRRGKLARVARRGKRADRTVILAPCPIDRPEALGIVCDSMNRGERVAVTFNGIAVTITRGKGGTYSATIPGRGKVNGIRTTANLTRRVSELVA